LVSFINVLLIFYEHVSFLMPWTYNKLVSALNSTGSFPVDIMMCKQLIIVLIGKNNGLNSRAVCQWDYIALVLNTASGFGHSGTLNRSVDCSPIKIVCISWCCLGRMFSDSNVYKGMLSCILT
jgi:hypothetical protein